MSKYEEKKQARIDRYLELAAKREQESDALYQQSHKMLEAIPLGQPLLVDHYSYKSDLHYRERAWNKMDKSMEAGRKAGHYAAKAAAAESNTAISSDDPKAIDKLTERLADLEDSHDLMKRVNAHYRKHGTCRGCEGLSDELADKVEEGIQYHSWDKTPFPAYALTNSSAEQRRVRERIQTLERIRDTDYVGWEFDGGRAEIDREGNRLQLFFNGKPPEEQRKQLKSAGFRWAPSEGAWQRQLKRTAFYAANELPFIYPLSGEKPGDLQPKAPPRTTAPEALEPEEKAAPTPRAADPEAPEGMRPNLGRIPPGGSVHDILEELEEFLEAVFTRENLPAYLNVLAKFHSYSAYNTALIAMQRPDAQQVTGFGTWKSKGRSVIKGESGIRILAPRPIRRESEDPPPPGQDPEKKVVKTLFKIVSVFDVSQTEGEDPPPIYTGLEEAHKPAFLSALHEILAPGHTYPLDNLAPAISAAVREHMDTSELCLGEDEEDPPKFETQAAAYAVCKRYGLPAPRLSLGALDTREWDTEGMKASLVCIRDTAAGLIDALDIKVYGKLLGRFEVPAQSQESAKKPRRTKSRGR